MTDRGGERVPRYIVVELRQRTDAHGAVVPGTIEDPAKVIAIFVGEDQRRWALQEAYDLEENRKREPGTRFVVARIIHDSDGEPFAVAPCDCRCDACGHCSMNFPPASSSSRA